MRCGEKCFLVHIDMDGEEQTQFINARSPAEARKTLRKRYGKALEILSVREERR